MEEDTVKAIGQEEAQKVMRIGSNICAFPWLLVAAESYGVVNCKERSERRLGYDRNGILSSILLVINGFRCRHRCGALHDDADAIALVYLAPVAVDRLAALVLDWLRAG